MKLGWVIHEECYSIYIFAADLLLKPLANSVANKVVNFENIQLAYWHIGLNTRKWSWQTELELVNWVPVILLYWRLEKRYLRSLQPRARHYWVGARQGCGAGVVRSRRCLCGVEFLTTLGVGFFVRLRLRMSNWIIFYITAPSWEFLLKWYNFFWNFVESEISCCVPRFPLILTAKFHSLYVKESGWGVGVGNFGKTESDILPSTPQPWCKETIHPRCCHWLATNAASLPWASEGFFPGGINSGFLRR